MVDVSQICWLILVELLLSVHLRRDLSIGILARIWLILLLLVLIDLEVLVAFSIWRNSVDVDLATRYKCCGVCRDGRSEFWDILLLSLGFLMLTKHFRVRSIRRVDIIEGNSTQTTLILAVIVWIRFMLSAWLKTVQYLLVENFDFLIELRIFGSNLLFVRIDLLELLWEFWQTLNHLLHHNYAEHQPLSIPSEGFNHKLQSDSLQHIIQKSVLDNRSKKLGNLSQIL